MNHRFLISLSAAAFAIALTVVSLAPSPAAAQTLKSGANAVTIAAPKLAARGKSITAVRDSATQPMLVARSAVATNAISPEYGRRRTHAKYPRKAILRLALKIRGAQSSPNPNL